MRALATIAVAAVLVVAGCTGPTASADDAVHVTVDGDTVTIVNAPTVNQLGDVYGPAG
jgi:ABC-type glycerol-3-phosphate transport system substrate-binding protein